MAVSSPTPESTQVTLPEGTAPIADRFRTITGSGSESPLPPPGRSGMASAKPDDDLASLWPLRWHRREAALRNLVDRLREPALSRNVLPNTARDTIREQCAADIEAVLAAGEDPRHGGLAS